MQYVMDLARRAILLGLAAMPSAMPSAKASAGLTPPKPLVIKPRAVRITGISHRVLTGTGDDTNVDDLGRDLEMHGTHFGDPAFVGPYMSEDQSKAVFKPRTPSRACVVRNGVALNDVHQGLIGDCWFLSALDFSIAHPRYRGRVADGGLFEEVFGGEPNVCRISLFDMSSDEWQVTHVGPKLLLDGMRFPATVSAVSSDPDELWPSLVEKGLAKMCTRPTNGTRGYNALGGGWMSEAMCYLHGRGQCYFVPRVEVLPRALEEPGHCARMMRALLDGGCGLFVVWAKEVFPQLSQGLVSNHGYAVLDVDPSAGTVTLKNPWGRGLWASSVSTGTDAPKGVFTMSVQDVIMRCAGLDVYEPAGTEELARLGFEVVPFVPASGRARRRGPFDLL